MTTATETSCEECEKLRNQQKKTKERCFELLTRLAAVFKSDINRDMRLAIYAVSGNLNQEKVGIAHDPDTALSMLHLIRLTGGIGCKIVGYGLDPNPEIVTNEEFGLDAARSLINSARIRKHFQPRELKKLLADAAHFAGK